MNKLEVIGSVEWCVFEGLGIPAIKARIDSGAKTSSIQAANIKLFTKGTQEWVRFEVNPIQANRAVAIVCEAKVVDRRRVKSSTGISEVRLVIKPLVTLGAYTFEIELTLANRDTMEYRMLLGREALGGRFIVNSEGSYCHKDFSDEEIVELYKSYFKQRTGLKIALLASNPELFSNKRLIQSAEARGHEIVFLNVESAYMKLDAHSPEIRYRGGDILKDFDAIIPRIKSGLTFYGCALLRQFDNLGVYCLNSAESISRSRDKLLATQLFSKNHLRIPITGFAKSPIDTKDLIRMVNGAPLIIKNLESTKGRDVVLAETDKAAEHVINDFKSMNTNILVQEFVNVPDVQYIRCFVVNGKVVASMKRQSRKGNLRANIHHGGKATNIKITIEEKKLVRKAAKVLNLVVAGVDIIRSDKGPLLLEVHSSPGLEAVETATGKDIATSMIMAIEKKLHFHFNNLTT